MCLMFNKQYKLKETVKIDNYGKFNSNGIMKAA